MIVGIIIGVVLVLIITWLIATYNNLVRQKNVAKNAWAQIDVQLKRRYDLIPNLVNTVKGYMKHERETLENVIKARNMAIDAKGVQNQAQAENVLTGALKSLFAVVEQYPDLKANENVMKLQEELTSTENRISYARQFYNDSVMRFNTMIQVFPTNIIAGMFNFLAMEFFEVAGEARENVKVDLNY